MTKTKCLLGFIALIFSAVSYAGNMYFCQDAKTGKKSAQDHPCGNATQIGISALPSPEELRKRNAKIENENRERDLATWKRKREWEMAHPGTYRPEEYMTREEYGEYQKQVKQQQIEAQRQQELVLTREAAQRAEQRAANAEQRSANAEAGVRQAREKASRPIHCTTSGQVMTPGGFIVGGSTDCY